MEQLAPKPGKSGDSGALIARAVALAVEFGFVISLPLVGFGLLGKWLDARFHHNKLFTLLGILLALFASSMWIGRRLADIRKELK